MSLGTLGAILLGNLLASKAPLQKLKVQLEQVKTQFFYSIY